MLKVGILASADATLGGVWQYTRSMVDALATDSSRRYVVITGEGTGPYDRGPLEVRKIRRLREREVAARALVALGAPARARHALASASASALADLDLLVCPENSFFPQLLLDKPFVYTLHDLQEQFLPEFFPLYKRVGRRFVRGKLARGARRVLCESRFVADSIVDRLGIPAERISVVPSPPPRAFLDATPSAEALRAVTRKYALPPDYLFYPAQFWHHKNHVRLLDAFERVAARHPSLHLVLTGSKQSGHGRMSARHRALGHLAAHVHVLGYVDYDDLPALYARSRMLVMPSLFESVSLPIWEAFSAGTPVAASRIQALPEQVGDAGVLFDPTDPRAIAEAIERILVEPELAARLVTAGRQRVAGFDHAAYAVSLARVIERASVDPPSPAGLYGGT